jgi:dipeptidyl aminopeptidase/acylaminoacyl peptidase
MMKTKISLALLLFSLVSNLTGEEMKTAPYGSWESPISAKMEGSSALRLSEAKIVKGTIYWLEGRPNEGGRVALMSWTKETGAKELLPKTYSVRDRVNEYGGGALLIGKSAIYFVHDGDQQIYIRKSNGDVNRITAKEKARFADGCESPTDGSLFYVMEEHVEEKVINTIVQVNPSSGNIEIIVSGNDFYSNPRISSDGKQLAYITWNDPNMPWDGTELWVLDLATKKQKKIAGGTSESIANPKWATDGSLYYVSDRSNWWNLYSEKKKIPNLEGEFTYPQWVFGTSWVEFTDVGIVVSYAKMGSNRFAKLEDGTWKSIDLPYTGVLTMNAEGNELVMIATSPNQPNSVIHYDLKTGKTTTVKSAIARLPDPAYISQPKSIEYPTADNKTAFAFYYPPCNPAFQGMPNEKPPLLVMSHGGPTAHLTPSFNQEILYWTSRGFAIAVVNYGGSTGYGREYRDRLKGTWGIVDVDDCCNAALYCAKQGLADRNRLTIEGGSAGGYTTLAVLAYRDVFRVGADYFGVSDLVGLATFTHKFEGRYLDQLVGPYPEMKDLYIERSPLYNADKIRCPVIIFQGAEDAVVPPAQSETMYNSLVERKIPTAYLLFPGEQHGFRRAENVARALEAQLYFFSKVLGFPLSEKIEPVEIVNGENL